MTTQLPPAWAKDAIPTEYGWANPHTGELLISIKGLSDVVKDYKRNQRLEREEPVVTSEEKTEEKPKRGRPKKQ